MGKPSEQALRLSQDLITVQKQCNRLVVEIDIERRLWLEEKSFYLAAIAEGEATIERLQRQLERATNFKSPGTTLRRHEQEAILKAYNSVQ